MSVQTDIAARLISLRNARLKDDGGLLTEAAAELISAANAETPVPA